ncbi:Vacuolar protein-sorting-associated protein 36 [Saxophila tyrrhenica]|uniref:Vacuolar protein-sorting-associated protein 36 n=1 Tax=Saxophila tyrrhenica TaxID=1690608 RepID=A0AAV9NY70_9PEZI|nr:Vacuolar protein-sorting-associated protein 36 [Saxophila tyrrhenica]
MFLRHLDLTAALRPLLYDEESLLFVQDNVGLYEGKFKIEGYQNGHAYLTSHRVCYVDKDEPRQRSVAVDLKEIERTEFYAGFFKSSPKITLFPKATKRTSQAIRSPVPKYASPSDGLVSSATTPPRSTAQTPAPARDLNATWVCPICGLSNPVPNSFDPATANQHTALPPCQACGIKPPLALMIKASIASMSSRASGTAQSTTSTSFACDSLARNGFHTSAPASGAGAAGVCPRCTFHNHASLNTCEMCGAPLHAAREATVPATITEPQRPESPGPSMAGSIVEDDTIETIKFSFRGGGEKVFQDRLKGALVQRKWLLQSAPPVPRPAQPTTPGFGGSGQTFDTLSSSTPQPRVVGIAGLERRGEELRQSNQAVIGTAFEDLEALMTSAKEVIAMAEEFSKSQNSANGDSVEARNVLSDSASVLGLVTTKDMLGTGSSSETLYITELARNLAEFLTDDRRGILRKEGGIMSLVDLWAVFNRTRNGIELISPLDFEKAAMTWETLHLPIRLRRFKSGLLVVQEKSRTDEKTIASLLSWLRRPQQASGAPEDGLRGSLGIGVTAQETAERFGWSVGVATEELEMAEDTGALCRDQCLDGIRFWENHFMSTFAQSSEQADADISHGVQAMGI